MFFRAVASLLAVAALSGAAEHAKAFRKLSRSLASGPQYLVAMFRPAVPPVEAEQILIGTGVVKLEHPDMLPNQWIVQATIEQAYALAERDEMLYLFPASDDLVARLPVAGCPGPVAPEPGIGLYVSTIGSGWDGPQRGGVALTYAFGEGSDKVSREEFAEVVGRVLAEWSRHARISFTYSADPKAAATLSFAFAARAHGDGYAFDGPGRVLAHTFYPEGVHAEPLAGDVHLDAEEGWANGGSTDLYAVLLHEVGHALGLGHADRPGAVMYPYYRRMSGLQPDDIAALQRIYAPPDETQPTPAQPAAALALTATSPLTTSAVSVALTGSITGGVRPYALSWAAGGASGTLISQGTWTLPEVALQAGSNAFAVSVRDAAGTSKGLNVVVTRSAVAASRDATGPALTVRSPAVTPFSTSAATLTVSGTARDASGVASVSWTCSCGTSGTAVGTDEWRTAPLPLRLGDTTIVITAKDGAGNSSRRTVQVTRR